MKTNPRVSIIIVNWNGKKIINKCLESVLIQDYKNIEVIVVDNNSTDGSVQHIRKYFKNIILVESFINLGFAGGNNLGLEKATGEYILLLNSDAEVTKSFLSPLVEVLQSKKKVGVVQPMVLYTDNDLHVNGSINSAGTFFLNSGFLYYPGYGKNSEDQRYKKENSIFSAYGACMLIKREVIDRVGLFDPDFFMYFEETDFCMRVLISGWKIYYIPDSIVYHKGGVSARKFGNARMIYHSYKNRIASYVKNLEGNTLLHILIIHLILCKAIAILYFLTGKFSYFLSIERALIWNIIKFPVLLVKRKKIQNEIRRVKDKSFLPDLTSHPRLSYYLYLFKGLQYYKE